MDERRALADREVPQHLLQHELIDVLQLGLQAKETQWCLRNHGSELARLLGEVATSCMRWADDLARELALAGVPPDGRITTVAASPNLVALTPTWREDREVAELASSRCRMFATWAEERAKDPRVTRVATRAVFVAIADGLHGFAAVAARLR